MSFDDRRKFVAIDCEMSRRDTIRYSQRGTYTEAYHCIGRWILQLKEITRGPKPKNPLCPTPEKKAYDSFDKAIRGWIRARNFYGAQQQAYKCRCGKFHNATLKKKRNAHQDKRQGDTC